MHRFICGGREVEKRERGTGEMEKEGGRRGRRKGEGEIVGGRGWRNRRGEREGAGSKKAEKTSS